MSYLAWFDEHAKMHKKIVKKLLTQGLTQEQIIDYFDFENMLEQESDFCPLYADKKKCHEMESLNCYLCACPNFRFDDVGFKKVEEKTQFSFCAIDSKDGAQGVYGEAIHQDCSKCGVPHHRSYVEKHFDLDWKKMMKKCTPRPKHYDFSSTTNFYEQNRTFSITPNTLTQEPKSAYKELQDAVAANYALEANQVALYSSHARSVKELFDSIKSKEVFLYTPLSGKYQKLALASKKNIYHINRINDLKEEPIEESIVVFENPSMPEGKYHQEIEELFEMWMELNCTIIIDESFIEFEDLASLREKIKTYKKLYIIQSFRRFYACDGVQVSAIFSHKKSIKKLSPSRETISTLDAAFLKERLMDAAFKSESQRLLREQKKELVTILEESKLFDEIAESNTNYILTHSKQGEAIYAHLKEQNILSRKGGSFEYLSDNWLRFSVQDEEAQEALKKALSDFGTIH
jgi:threonine-phosphate decarboxylase